MGDGQLVKNYIVIHHSLTPLDGHFQVPAIRKYHIETNGWANIGYHWILNQVNGHTEIVMGRFPFEQGAHCPQALMNKRGLGLCLVGNFDLEEPPIEMWERAIDFCFYLMRTNDIAPSHVIGHREAQAMGGIPPEQRKSCPGLKFDMDKLRAALVS
jgi:N-acetylmuramoyl-L-alanine amidase